MPLKRALLAWGAAGVAAAFLARPTAQWVVERVIAARHDTPTIAPQALAAQLAGGRAPLLLDVRTVGEFEVSHLPDAIRVDPDVGAVAGLVALARGRPIVVYCAVGERSGVLGDRLRQAGAEVQNLQGGIFRWAREGRRLVGPGAPAVHPYGAPWHLLLPPNLRQSHSP